MIRTKGEAGSGNIVEAVRHIRAVSDGIAEIRALLKGRNTRKLRQMAEAYRVSYDLVVETARLGKLTVVNFAAGGIATPSDAALCMQLGVDGVFVGSGIFKSSDPRKTAKAIVDAVAHFNDAKKLAEISGGLGEPMKGQEISTLETRLSARGV